MPPPAFVGRAPAAPFVSGPHTVTDEHVSLAFDAGSRFGHYDPAFVRWLPGAAIPEGAAARALAQPVYDRRVSRLAHAYWLTYADLAGSGFPETVPAGPLADYVAYLATTAGPADEGFSVFAFNDRSDRLLPTLALPPAVNEWEARYELNTAYGFWLRRRADGTADEWADGLRQLLGAFDAE